MIYNLFLNSTTNTPLTNYVSAVSAANRGQRLYAVDWTFLPQNKKFKVSFKFVSRQLVLTANSIYYVSANFTQPTSVTAGSVVTRKPNTILGTLKPRRVSSDTDCQLTSNPDDNEPVYLLDRPANNFLEITILDTSTALQYNLAADYLMVLTFDDEE